jgi:Predicted transcriptional regulators
MGAVRASRTGIAGMEGDMNLEEMLGFFTLTRQEATLYLLLCAEGGMTGYEAAKASGISRSNAYTALADLVDKGAAFIEEGKATRYAPVPVAEFCQNRLRKMQEYRDLLVSSVPGRREEAEGYLTVRGESNIYDKMNNLIDGARERIYIAVSDRILVRLLTSINDAIRRKLRVVIITDPEFCLDGAEIYHTKTSQQQIRLIADSKNVLTGDIAYGADATCLYSQKKNLVDLFKESLKNEIELIKIKERS